MYMYGQSCAHALVTVLFLGRCVLLCVCVHEACGSPLCVYVCDHKCMDLYKAITRYRHIHIVSRLYIIIMYTCIFYAIGDTISIDRHVGKCVCVYVYVCVCACACVCMRVCVCVRV